MCVCHVLFALPRGVIGRLCSVIVVLPWHLLYHFYVIGCIPCILQTQDALGCQGNLMLDRMCGAQLYMVPVKSPYLTELKPRMERLADYLK